MTNQSTLITQLSQLAQEAPTAPALHGGSPKSGFSTLTWADYYAQSRSVGKALIALGVEVQDNVSITGRNRPEWALADLGVMAAGAIPTPIYATNTADQVAWLINHCGAAVAIIDDQDQYEKFAAQRDKMPDLKHVVLMGDTQGRDTDWTLSWDEFLKIGESVPDAAIDTRIATAKPDDLALLCYTSGTTGEPKGVMLTHRNFEAAATAVTERFPFNRLDERIVSYLPLCHIAEHVFTLVNQMNSGVEVWMCSDLNEMKDYLPAVRPTLFLAVPRVWEKFEAALRAKLSEASGLKSILADWALTTEFSWFESELQSGKPITGVTRKVANKIVLDKIKSALGLDEVRYCFSGAAPLNKTTADFFASLGLPIHEVYGMTETTALITFPEPGQARSGFVGFPSPHLEIKIADDGEILARGPNITPGYFKNEAETAALIDSEGWLQTGDIGKLDENNFMRITDRKKELFKTSGGKYIAPAPIEAKLKSIPGVSQAVLVGDGQKYVAALVALDPENVAALVATLDLSDGIDAVQAAKEASVQIHIESQVEELVNIDLARYEQIKRVTILPHELTPETGELTPTLKLRRKAIGKEHADKIASLFA